MVPTIGTQATIKAVMPEARCVSAVVSRIHGMAISITANANTGRHRRRAARIAPCLAAMITNTVAANEVRLKTTTGGSSSFTATRIMK